MPNTANSRSHVRLLNGTNMAVSAFRCVHRLIVPFTWMLRLTLVLRQPITFRTHNQLLEMLRPGMKYQQLQCHFLVHAPSQIRTSLNIFIHGPPLLTTFLLYHIPMSTTRYHRVLHLALDTEETELVSESKKEDNCVN